MKQVLLQTPGSVLKRVASIASVVAVGAFVVLGATSAMAGTIIGSKHDLSTGGIGQGAGGGAATGEICVFCHTPHGSDTAAQVPLWNKKLPSPSSYQTYSTLGTATLDGNEAPVGSVSLACLSCHDGSQAMDAVLNAPGSGGYNAAGAVLGGGTGTTMAGSPIPMLGTDLTNDHPVGIVYGGYEGPDMAGFKTQTSATINGNTQYWVDTAGGGVNIRDKTDMMLYTRGAASPKPRVECASCHDPHNGGAGTQTFLRILNANSAVCLSCHIK